MRPGQSILLADGTVDLEVESAAPREIVCRVVLGGVLTNHKGVNAVAWMAWEIRKAIELKKKLVAAKTDSTNNSPTAMQGVGASWSTIFNFDSIKKALN